MPTATEYFGIGLTNNGPLTTTYTSPASCTTVTTDQIFFAKPDYISEGYGAPTCETASMGKCLPPGSNYDKQVAYLNEYGGQGAIDYYSPGIACPKGWTTAGTLAHGNETGSVEKSGVFTQTRSTLPGVSVTDPNMPLEQIWLNALGPSETLAYCCPRYIPLPLLTSFCCLVLAQWLVCCKGRGLLFINRALEISNIHRSMHQIPTPKRYTFRLHGRRKQGVALSILGGNSGPNFRDLANVRCAN
ncbi:hypothetical protein AU210_012701 [Fusarium oxysporum f. sp. radicis-cucumerinum]|uniref:Uncharacterized protein n=1 Tax=Fusarium oxysporum f. sp. radicis-cucumerinum TaxID=327505 RepID=A0A2H3G9A6_FUSOX|nr:hypothetical protein AU210_012701 [Fusarium oxysporum f. sp. radicis-cucumerinum]